MPSIVTVGELLVEIMRTETDVTFSEPGEFVGPFPSGAPAIFVDAAARLGGDTGIVGAVGEDGFGRCITDRLRRDGVDIARVLTVARPSTGVAFVTYFSDGSREFIYHMENAAAGTVEPDDVPPEYIADADTLHINGSSLLMGSPMREACYEAIRVATERDLTVSFDPNVRAELLDGETLGAVIDPILNAADLVVPTETELEALAPSDATDAESRARALLDRGASTVAIKRGASGCTIVTTDSVVSHPGFEVDPEDPTGAGDAFSAGIVVGTLERQSTEELAAFANAAGARATTAVGPMEGLADRERVDSMVSGR